MVIMLRECTAVVFSAKLQLIHSVMTVYAEYKCTSLYVPSINTADVMLPDGMPTSVAIRQILNNNTCACAWQVCQITLHICSSSHC